MEQMNELINEWINQSKSESINQRMNEWIDEWMRWKDDQMYGRIMPHGSWNVFVAGQPTAYWRIFKIGTWVSLK